jgi:hypothetical protein
MTDTQPSLPLPNPGDWTDAAGAADLLGRSRPAVYDMVDRGVIHKYRLGSHTLYWVPEIQQVAAALQRVARTNGMRCA